MESRPNHGQENLFAEFLPIPDADWEARLLKELKGKPLEKLDWDTPEGFKIKAYYREKDIEALLKEESSDSLSVRRGDYIKLGNPSWQPIQAISLTDIQSAMQRLQTAQEAEIKAYLFEENIGNLPELLPNLDVSRTAVHIRSNEVEDGVWEKLKEAAYHNDTKIEWITGTCFIDPYSLILATKGKWELIQMERLESILQNTEDMPYFRSLGIDMTYVLDQGGSCSQQLGLALATTLEYLMYFSEKGTYTVENLLPKLAFLFSTSSSFFMEIAKLRAFRLLFARLVELLEVEADADHSPFILATNTTWNKTLSDRHNNLLRSTTEAVSAVLGGTHGMIVRPFDHTLAEDNEFSHRLARNIQQLLAHESYLGKVVDPGGGSYYLETLTEALADQAWGFFQEIEKEGGLLAAHTSGFISGRIEQTKEEQLRKLATARKSLIGVNRYPNMDEEAKDLLNQGLLQRASSPFEEVKRESLTKGQGRGTPLKAKMILFGDPLMRTARATFSENVMGVLGWDTEQEVWNEGKSVAKADVFVLCSADESYPEMVPMILESFRDDGHYGPIILAGKNEQASDWGIEFCLYRGINLLEFHHSLMQQLS
ncbi:MAG: methylmalonyl-CoA mutase family protein [Bacteroidota bacterium]